ncbi:MAG TPA: AlpA family transcriptional regulator [Burkholderiales bacterium]|nr:AlpA family transcriptional regulator [Burkholderiales bacterium]
MTETVQQGATTLLRMRHVKARTGLSRSTIYLKIKTGEFPAQVSLGPRAVGWLEAEVDRWIASCIKRSRGGR